MYKVGIRLVSLLLSVMHNPVTLASRHLAFSSCTLFARSSLSLLWLLFR